MTDDLDALATSQDPAVGPGDPQGPVPDPAVDAVAEPVADAAADTLAEPVADALAEPVADAVAEPVDDTVAEPVADPAPEPVLDAVPVLAEARTLEVPYTSLPAVQAAAVAATSFVAGAATLALVKRHSAKKVAKARATRRAVDMLPIVGSRTFLVDVHLLAKPGE